MIDILESPRRERYSQRIATMHRLTERPVYLGLLLLTLIGFGPGAVTAQTPADTTPESIPGVQIVTIGATGVQSDAGARLGDLNGSIHVLQEVTIEPGAALPDDFAIPSTVIQVTSGSIVVSVSEGVASVSIGSGLPIQSLDGAQVVCAAVTCELQVGQEIVLGPGNGISLTESLFQAQNPGDEPAVLHGSVLLPGSILDDPLCWICPTT